MTKEELDRIFTKNYTYYKQCTNNHCYKTSYNLDVVMSNSYMNLVRNLHKLNNEKDVTAFIVTYAHGLIKFKQNRVQMLTEKAKDSTRQNTVYLSDNFDVIDNDQSDIYDKYISLRDEFLNTLPTLKQIMLMDYLNGVDRVFKVAKWYSLKNTSATSILQKMRALNDELEAFIKENIENN